MNEVRKNFAAVFFKEWDLFLKKGAELRSTAEVSATRENPFDAPVRIGEIRVFAETEGPLVGLVLAEQSSDGYLVVPISDFTVPATEQEILIGKRVYQLWNSFTESRDFASKSWIVDTVPPVDKKDIARALSAVLSRKSVPLDLIEFTGLPIVKMNDPRLDYERRFAAQLDKDGVLCRKVVTKHVFPLRMTRRQTYGIAACFIILLGMSVVLLNDEAAKTDSDGICEVSYSCAEPEECELQNRCPPKKKEVEAACAEIKCARDACLKMMKVGRNSFSHSSDKMELKKCAPCAPAAEASCAPLVRVEPEAIGYERYSEYKENDFVEVKTQPLSTFGLDVDTASYATMRRYVQKSGRLPPQDSVRLEEYVNYFRYNYAEPENGAPIGVDCELAECPWNKGHRLLRVGVQAKHISRDKLPPSNLVFLLDCSGSMGYHGGFDIAVKSMRLLVDQLEDNDSVAIVTYASDTEIKLPATKVREKAEIMRVINSLKMGGCTYGSGGIQLAYDEAKKNFDSKANNRVILVTDGDFNVGVSSAGELVRMIEGMRESGVFLSVLGVGRGNYQDAMMKKLANAGNGNYAYLDSLVEARKILMTEFTGSMYTVAKDVKLQLEFNPSETAAYRLLGYEHRRLAAKDFNDDNKDSGEIGSGHSMTALYELIPVGASNEVARIDELKYQKTTVVGSGELLTVKLRYKEPDGDVSKLIETPLTSAAIIRKDDASEDFRFASAVAEFALILEDSKFKGSASLGDAIARAKKAKGTDDEGYRAEFVRLAESVEMQLTLTETEFYTIRKGDTLSGIASKFGTTVKTIKLLNALPDDGIKAGAVIKVPARK